MATTVNEPRLERREAVISAKELLESLKGFGSDRAPEYGIHLMRVASQKIKLYDLGNKEVILRAENIIHYTEKGFTPTVSDTALDGRKKLDILEGLGMTERHDVVPKREHGTTEVREPYGKNTELIAGAKKGRRGKTDEPDEDEAKAKEEDTSPVKTQKPKSGPTPPAGRAGISDDQKKDQSIEESKNAKDPAAQPAGALYPQDSSRMGKK